MTERLAADAAGLARAADILGRGGLVAFPTETVYGLGARADDAAAVRSIFAAKGRPSANPLIVHVAEVEGARALALAWPAAAERFARAFWPGPLTLVVERRRGEGGVADEVTAGGPTVALRVPVHPVARALLHAAALPIAAPSANASTGISPTSADHVLKTLAGRIDAVVDDGARDAVQHGIESAIVDVTRSPAVLLRRGALSIAALRAVAPIVDRGHEVVADGDRPAAPGAYARHYAPRALVRLVDARDVRDDVASLAARGMRVGAIERGASTAASSEHAVVVVLPEDPVGYAAGLYAALHRLEDAGCVAIVLAAAPEGEAWDAVRDRLARASA